MSIQTPNIALKIDELDSSQLLLLKERLKLTGKNIYPVTKPATYYYIDIPLEEYFVYKGKNSSIIYGAGTLRDSLGNEFTIITQGYLSLPINSIINIVIISTNAYISSPIQLT
jgi:hypothetical protein